MSARGEHRPRLALPFTILTAADTVRLVAGEDFRYSLSGTNLSQWLPELLRRCDGRQTLEQLLAELGEPLRKDARTVIVRLYGERVLIDGTAEQNHQAAACQLTVSGTGALATLLGAERQDQDDHSCGQRQALHVLCQDRLDYEAALQFNRRCRAGISPWLWASTGAMSRGYVSPVFVSDAGPCLECLLRTFQRLSPAPEIYDDLRGHTRQDRPIAPVPFPEEGVAILREIIRRKLIWLNQTDPPPALYRLHVLEAATLEITTHRVLPDPRCPACGEGC